MHSTINRGKERIVATLFDIGSWMDSRAALPDDYRAGVNLLSAITLNTQTLGIAIATVFRATNALFMSHGIWSFRA